MVTVVTSAPCSGARVTEIAAQHVAHRGPRHWHGLRNVDRGGIMRSALTFVMMALATVGACAEPNLEEPDPLPLGEEGLPARGSTKTTPPVPSPSGSADTQAPSVPDRERAPGSDPPPQSKRWSGKLPSTPRVQFGGGQYCAYRIRLEQVKVDVVAAPNGDVVAATVTGNAVEERIDPACGNPPYAPNVHTYALTKATPLANGTTRIELAGLSTNKPAASLVVEGDLRTAYPALSLAWHRTDYGAPLDWRVTTQITVSPM